MSSTVVKYKSSDKSGIARQFVRHVHNFDHVEIDFFTWIIVLDDLNCLDNDINHLVCNVRMKLALKRSLGNLKIRRIIQKFYLAEKSSIDVLLNLEFLEVLKTFVL